MVAKLLNHLCSSTEPRTGILKVGTCGGCFLGAPPRGIGPFLALRIALRALALIACLSLSRRELRLGPTNFGYSVYYYYSCESLCFWRLRPTIRFFSLLFRSLLLIGPRFMISGRETYCAMMLRPGLILGWLSLNYLLELNLCTLLLSDLATPSVRVFVDFPLFTDFTSRPSGDI